MTDSLVAGPFYRVGKKRQDEEIHDPILASKKAGRMADMMAYKQARKIGVQVRDARQAIIGAKEKKH